uniref:Uncharacterized protein n=1 Tax=Glossina austeni TaxID=7395 RepID=A0A1A9VQ01_GLOAU
MALIKPDCVHKKSITILYRSEKYIVDRYAMHHGWRAEESAMKNIWPASKSVEQKKSEIPTKFHIIDDNDENEDENDGSADDNDDGDGDGEKLFQLGRERYQQ